MENAEMKIVKFDCGDVLTTSGAGGTMTCGSVDNAPDYVWGQSFHPYNSSSAKLVLSIEEWGSSFYSNPCIQPDQSYDANVYDGSWTFIGTLNEVHDPNAYYHDLGYAGVQICYNVDHHPTN